MKKIKNFSQTISLMLAFIMLCVSCETYDTPEQVTSIESTKELRSKLSQYDGEELFRAIFFQQGELVDDIPTLKKFKLQREKLNDNGKRFVRKNGLADKYNEFADKVVEYINQNDPQFFSEFHLSVNNDNPEKLKGKIKEAAEMLRTVLVKGYENTAMYDVVLKKVNDENLTVDNISIEELEKEVEQFSTQNCNPHSIAEFETMESCGSVFVIVAVVAVAVAVVIALAFWGEQSERDVSFERNMLVKEIFELRHDYVL